MSNKVNKFCIFTVRIFSSFSIVIGGVCLIGFVKTQLDEPLWVGNLIAFIIAIPTLYWTYRAIIWAYSIFPNSIFIRKEKA
jgi:hypothetical protein